MSLPSWAKGHRSLNSCGTSINLTDALVVVHSRVVGNSETIQKRASGRSLDDVLEEDLWGVWPTYRAVDKFGSRASFAATVWYSFNHHTVRADEMLSAAPV
jgi:hypothetical protein